jgi:hypothetical protein
MKEVCSSAQYRRRRRAAFLAGPSGKTRVRARMVTGAKRPAVRDLDGMNDGALERLDLVRDIAPLVVPEVRVVRSPGDDQAVVFDRVRTGDSLDGPQPQPTTIEIEAGHLGH